MQPAETIYIDEDTVGCDGGGGALGHPLVYLTLAPRGEIDCPYCGRHYVQTAAGKAAGGGHGH
ncbi:zinc-finger domain-containing protein [Niveispirillum fermenti]